jgi:hypothetical protein
VTDVGELTTVGRDFKDESREGWINQWKMGAHMEAYQK